MGAHCVGLSGCVCVCVWKRVAWPSGHRHKFKLQIMTNEKGRLIARDTALKSQKFGQLVRTIYAMLVCEHFCMSLRLCVCMCVCLCVQ